MSVKLALVDDHQLVRSGIKLLLENTLGYKVIIEASNGREFLDKLENSKQLPQIAFIDVTMPILNGFDTCKILKEQHPKIKVIALSVHNDLKTISAMIESGANAYLLKDSSPELVKSTVMQVTEKGYYYDKIVIESFIQANVNEQQAKQKKKMSNDLLAELTEREIEFIKHCCTELTYKEIAHLMGITPRTVDGYRESVFLKLNLKSRTGIVLFSVHNDLYR